MTDRSNATIEHHIVEDQSRVIAFLLDPLTHRLQEPVARIDTQNAILFLAGEDVFKLKRAVRLPFMDFSTAEKRRKACEAEIAVNRSAAPGTYLGLLPIVDRHGTLAIGGEGDVLDWVVHMRRFDEKQTLDRIAEEGGLTPALVSEIVSVVLASHERAPRRDGDVAINALAKCIRENDEAFAELPRLFPAHEVHDLTRSADRALDRLRPLLAERGRQGFVRRCHGDLHLQNIVLSDGKPMLFDAIEFDDAVATTDVLYDLAFLLMDLWHRGLRHASNAALNAYLWASDDENLDGLAALPLFLSLRAAIRAKVVAIAASLHGPEAAAAERQAESYFQLARQFLEPAPPRLVAIGGLSGTGKSTLAAGLATDLGPPPGAVLLRSDVERKRLKRVALQERLPEADYSADTTDEVYLQLRQKAGRVLDAGYCAIVDAVHANPAERSSIESVATDRGVPFVGLWLEAPVESRLQRVAKRASDVSDATGDIVRRQASYDLGDVTWTRIDAAETEAKLIHEAASALAADLKGVR